MDIGHQSSAYPWKQRGNSRLTINDVYGLPASVNLRTAADALGISINTAYKLVHEDRFPCAVLRPGYRYRVPSAGLKACLGIKDPSVSQDDVDRGAAFDEEHG